MILENFFPCTGNLESGEINYDLLNPIAELLGCSLEEIYVVGDDNGIPGFTNDPIEQLGASYFIQQNFFLKECYVEIGDDYLSLWNYNGVKIVATDDHGYTNCFIAKSDITKLPNMTPEDHKLPYGDDSEE